MTLAGDHSTGGAIIGGTLRRQGFKGLVRYACAGRGDVNITPAEVADLKANDIPVGIVVEHAADWLLEAPALTAQRFAGARDICRACGLPDGVIYAAADFDATNGGPTSPGSPGDQNMHRILAGLEAAAATIGAGNVGFYGSYYAIAWLIPRAPWLKFYWQTLAWSHGNHHPAAALFQFASSVRVAGVAVDVDSILKAQWGQRVHPAPPPPPRTPHGIANAGVHLDFADGRWSVNPAPGQIALGPSDRYWEAKVAVNEKTGRWVITPLPFAPA